MCYCHQLKTAPTGELRVTPAIPRVHLQDSVQGQKGREEEKLEAGELGLLVEQKYLEMHGKSRWPCSHLCATWIGRPQKTVHHLVMLVLDPDHTGTCGLCLCPSPLTWVMDGGDRGSGLSSQVENSRKLFFLLLLVWL